MNKMNNIFLNNNDPLLYNGVQHQATPDFQAMQNYYAQLYRRQMENNPNAQKDVIGELETILSKLEPGVAKILSEDTEYKILSEELEGKVKNEIMRLVKSNLNTDNGTVECINKQMKLIDNAKLKYRQKEEQERDEIHDYLSNYSDMTFNEYKNIKNKPNIKETKQNTNENKRSNTKSKKVS